MRAKLGGGLAVVGFFFDQKSRHFDDESWCSVSPIYKLAFFLKKLKLNFHNFPFSQIALSKPVACTIKVLQS
jgi:hypothetical protein